LSPRGPHAGRPPSWSPPKLTPGQTKAWPRAMDSLPGALTLSQPLTPTDVPPATPQLFSPPSYRRPACWPANCVIFVRRARIPICHFTVDRDSGPGLQSCARQCVPTWVVLPQTGSHEFSKGVEPVLAWRSFRHLPRAKTSGLPGDAQLRALLC